MNNEKLNLQEKNLFVVSGWAMILFDIVLLVFILLALLIFRSIGLTAIFVVLFLVGSGGFFILNPNQAVVATFFGDYAGSVKNTGFYWNNPFNKHLLISIKTNNLTTQQIKVNDKSGNPIEIAAMFVWCVADTAKASFAVENYAQYLKNQCDSALRNIAAQYAYDSEDAITFKSSSEEISHNLKMTLDKAVHFAGLTIEDARITHLAYAPEIAQAMLRKQQAEAVVAARKKIVEGAINMVQEVLEEMQSRHLAEFENVEKVKLINNLMTVLVSESEAKPVVQLDK